MIPRRPAWIRKGALYDFDFVNGRYWGGIVQLGSIPGVETLLAPNNGAPNTPNILFAPDSKGILYGFPAYSLRITDLGLWAEGNSRNYALWCRDLTNAAWTKTNVTVAKNQTGADLSANGACLVTATATDGTVTQQVTQASAQYIGHWYIKRVSGSGTVSVMVDGTNYTDVTSLLNTNGFVLSPCAPATLANPTLGLKLGTSGDSVAVDFAQLENSHTPTTPMVTTTTLQFRGPEEPTFSTLSSSVQNAGQVLIDRTFVNNPMSFAITVSGNAPAASSPLISGNDIGSVQVRGVVDGGALTFRLATTANTGNVGLGILNKVAGRIAGAVKICLNGGAFATSTQSVTYSPSTHGALGNNGAGVAPINGYIQRVTYWNYEISDGELLEYTR